MRMAFLIDKPVYYPNLAPMFNRILVPVDFSPNATAALAYAQRFAAAMQAKAINVVHVFTPQTASASAIYVPPMETLMQQRDEQLATFIADHPAPAGLTQNAELLLGFAADKIVEESESFDLVIMGTNGEKGLLEQLFGSVSTTVAQKCSRPVLLIPPEANFHPYQHILYASNQLSISRAVEKSFRVLNQLFAARVHFVHVNDQSAPPEPGEREALFAPLFDIPDPEFAFELHEIQADTVHAGLTRYLKEQPIDLAVMVTRERSFWERLFQHSETQQMILHPRTPLLIIQDV